MSSTNTQSACVVKLGGSLLDLPDLGDRLRRWLAARATARVLLIPGGGRAADLVRDWDRLHGLGWLASHWLALRAMTFNAHLLRTLLPDAPIVADVTECDKRIAILDAHAFCLADAERPGCLPATWEVTSDSLAARVAQVAGAELVLLKSAESPAAGDWPEAARTGYVDRFFPQLAQKLSHVTAINLRTWGD